ncbi:hypothetical protein FBUS_01286 [Fasciolopsis buskii]|uniref:G-protein coupled receptors family 1 profile domain-containing protein n=1 Tax=Fasciolopsis buskii TaxID=27845 RepID=A0A8E0RQG7_9TREM|nr:hypothetical protein FBUS_01286 [Fasciolopsis buski]
MNSTIRGQIYETVRVPTTTNVIFGFLAPVFVIGALVNVITCCGVYNIQLESIVTKCLLYNECVFDMLICSTVFSLLIPIKPQVGLGDHNVVICYLLKNASLMTFLRMLMNFNIVCLALDRFWAIVYCSTYKQRRIIYLIVCYVIIILSSSVITVPSFFQVAFYENACVVTLDVLTLRAQMMLNIVIAYIIPLIVVSVTGFWASRVLRKRRHTPANVSCEGSDYDRVQNTLLAITLGFGLVLAILAIIGLVMSILSILGLLDFRYDSISRMYFNSTCGVASSLIPIIHTLVVPPLRRWYLTSFRSIYFRVISISR